MKQTLLLLALCPMSVVLAETLGPYIQLNQTFGASEYKIKFHKVSGGGDFYLSSDFQSETSSLDLSTKNIWLKNEGDSALVLKGVNINNSKDVTNGITDTLYGILVEEGKVVIDNIDTGDLQSNLSIGTGRGNLEATLIIKNGSQVQTTARYNTIGANGSTGHLNIEGQDTAFITNQITCGSPQCLQANTSTVISGTELNYDGYSSKSTEGKYLVGYGIIEVSDGATMHVGKGNTDTSTNKLQIFNGEVNINSASLVMHDKTILSMDSSHGNIPIDDVPDSKSHLIVKNGGSLKTAESAKLSTLAIGRSFHDNKADSKIEVSGENSLLDLSVSGICYVGGTGKKDLTAQGESTISLLAEDNGSAKITSDSYAVIAYNNTDSTTKQDVDIKASSGGSVELQTGTGVYIGRFYH